MYKVATEHFGVLISVTNCGDTRCYKKFDEAYDFATEAIDGPVELIEITGAPPGPQLARLDPENKDEIEFNLASALPFQEAFPFPSPVDMTNRRFVCRSPGVAAVTKIWQKGNVYRLGIAIMGNASPGSDNPFDRCYNDNYIEATADTADAALESIMKQMKEMSDGLWA
jgi:hypothetical protein